jgi:hypothetical protein
MNGYDFTIELDQDEENAILEGKTTPKMKSSLTDLAKKVFVKLEYDSDNWNHMEIECSLILGDSVVEFIAGGVIPRPQ